MFLQFYCRLWVWTWTFSKHTVGGAYLGPPPFLSFDMHRLVSVKWKWLYHHWHINTSYIRHWACGVKDTLYSSRLSLMYRCGWPWQLVATVHVYCLSHRSHRRVYSLRGPLTIHNPYVRYGPYMHVRSCVQAFRAHTSTVTNWRTRSSFWDGLWTEQIINVRSLHGSTGHAISITSTYSRTSLQAGVHVTNLILLDWNERWQPFWHAAAAIS